MKKCIVIFMVLGVIFMLNIAAYADSNISLTVTKTVGTTRAIDRNSPNYGRQTFPNGGEYEGEMADGVPNGYGEYKFPNGDMYVGDWVNGRPHGWGIITYLDGGKYEGDMFEGRRHGRGITTFPDGIKYEGDMFEGKRHGQGIQTYPNGEKYEGSWSEGLMEGNGSFIYFNGDMFTGVFRDDNPSSGTYTFANGGTAEVVWRDGQYVETQTAESRETPELPSAVDLLYETESASIPGDYMLRNLNMGADVVLDAAKRGLEAYRSAGHPVPSSGYNTLYQALELYQMTVNNANQMGLSDDPQAVYARSKISEIRGMLRR